MENAAVILFDILGAAELARLVFKTIDAIEKPAKREEKNQ